MNCYYEEVNLWGMLMFMQYTYGTYIILYEMFNIYMYKKHCTKCSYPTHAMFLILLMLTFQVALLNLVFHNYREFELAVMTLNGFIVSSILLAVIIEIINVLSVGLERCNKG